MKQLSASKTDLFLQCQRPFADDTPEPDEDDRPKAARDYGTQFHKALEVWVSGHGHIDDPKVIAHAKAAMVFLQNWMTNYPSGPLNVIWTEKHLATRLLKSGIKTRACEFDEATHTYALRLGEIGGTGDLLVQNEKTRIIIDYKTGTSKNYSNPKTGQMLTLALMTNANAVAIFHSPPGGLPVIYEEPVTKEELQAHAKALRLQRARVGDGSLRPGPECRYCPVKGTCPTQHGELLVQTTALVRKTLGAGGLTQEIDRGVFYPMLGKLEKLAKLAREQIKEEVEMGEVYETPDGKTLTIVSVEGRESISKKSILEAMGEKEGGEMLNLLRAKGAIKESSWTELRA